MVQDPNKWAKINMAEHLALGKFTTAIAPYGGRCCMFPRGMEGTDIILTFRDGRSLRVCPAELADQLSSTASPCALPLQHMLLPMRLCPSISADELSLPGLLHVA